MQKTPIHEILYSRGLCATCRSAPGCTFPRRAGVPVLDCLEFDGERRVEEARPARITSRKSEPRTAAEPGLCGWCDKRTACTFPRGVGGIWFCEEYQ
jgi:hypothetical protein